MRLLVSVSVSTLICFPALTLALAVAQAGWLPPEVEDGAARQLASRISEIGAGESDETRLAGAQQLVGVLRERLESWGEKGVISRAPSFPELGIPESGRRRLDAMARYQVCNMVLMLQLRNPASAEDQNAKVTSVTGLTAFTLAVLYLRLPFLQSGGDDAQIEAFLTSASMTTVLEKMQSDAALRRHAERQCTPPLLALLEPKPN